MATVEECFLTGANRSSCAGEKREVLMLAWIKSCARIDWRVSMMRRAVRGVVAGAEPAVMDQLEPRRFLDSCTVTTTTMEYFGNTTADNVTVEVNSGTISIKNAGT